MALTNAVVAPRYARALFEAAQETDQLDNVHTELNALGEIISQNASLLPTLSAVTVAQSDKQQLVDTLKQEATSLVANLLQVTFEYGRIAAMPAIIADFEQRYADAIGQLDATITTAVELTPAQEQALSQAITARFGGQKVQLTTKVDPDVLGGVMVQTRTAVVDGTVKTRLAKLRAQLLAK
ncbi:ATP synthase F1 subunit delta [Lacticaseibacillus baoqingensis]|uniref:ATP synthase subunit delta n=1 Tax=Lacticaseibacillus baoqingensis TaxID=2486013 RepID=A0ABW4E9Z9_9LACO|nr:ATP synthase F1 subunit delta [Lacticaseibacillus baoqingensis]